MKLEKSEGVGFEPTVRQNATLAFQASSLSHSDTPPLRRNKSISKKDNFVNLGFFLNYFFL